jgi:hypothetical protein
MYYIHSSENKGAGQDDIWKGIMGRKKKRKKTGKLNGLPTSHLPCFFIMPSLKLFIHSEGL